MSNKKDNKHIPAREVNQAIKSVKKENREIKQKSKADQIVKWIFISLLILAVLYMVWTMHIVG
ncbi:MAG: hypothetical protein I3J02_02650 [Prevotella sp.]|nr:hypothetical protein [Prevotella sp.]